MHYVFSRINFILNKVNDCNFCLVFQEKRNRSRSGKLTYFSVSGNTVNQPVVPT